MRCNKAVPVVLVALRTRGSYSAAQRLRPQVLQDILLGLKSLLHKKAFMNKLAQTRLEDIRLDPLSKLPSVTSDRALTADWRLYFGGDLHYQKREPSLHFATILGVDFFINRGNNHTSQHECPVSAWMAKITEDKAAATMETEFENVPIYIWVENPDQNPWGLTMSYTRPSESARVLEVKVRFPFLKAKPNFYNKKDVMLCRELTPGEELKRKRGEKESNISTILGACGYCTFTKIYNEESISNPPDGVLKTTTRAPKGGGGLVPMHLLK